MGKMTDDELVTLLDGEFISAMGAPGGDISIERAASWDFYLSKALGNEIEGQSQVVTSDVADVVDSIMPSLLRMFTTADNLVGFDPVHEDDVQKAEQESDYVNYVFFKQNDAFLNLYTWFFDALVQKNGILKIWWAEEEEVSQESYRGLTEDQLLMMLGDEELEPVEREERIEDVPGPDGQTVTQETVHDIIFRRITKRGRVKVAPVPPEEYRISADSNSLDPSAARLVGQEREVTRSDLLDIGFDKDIVAELQSVIALADTDEKRSRRDRSDEQTDTPHDPSQDKILLREGYIRVDFDGDGRSELRQVTSAGGKILSNEIADRSPFHVISPQPLPHKHFGRATAEKVMDIQLVSTTLTRQTLDNLYRTNQPGHGVWEQALGENTIDDLLTTRVGQVTTFTRPVGEAYQPMTVPFTAAATFPMLEYYDKVKRDRTGVSSDSQGLSPDALKNIQTSVLAQAFDMSRMKIEAIARIFAETGIKSAFMHIHELLLKHQRRGQMVQLREKWIEVNPKEWRTRYDMTVNIGLGIGTREQNLLHLRSIGEIQQQIVGAGGFGKNGLVTPMNVFNFASQTVKNANLKSPKLFFNPVEDIPQQSDEQTKLQQAQQALAERQQGLDADKQALAREKLTMDHDYKMQQLEVRVAEVQNNFLIAMEDIRAKLTAIDVKTSEHVPGSKLS